MHSGAGTSDFLLTDMLGPHYHRLDPVMTDFIPFDALDRLDELFALAEQADMTETIGRLVGQLGMLDGWMLIVCMYVCMSYLKSLSSQATG